MVDLNVDAAFVRGIASSMDRASAPLQLGSDLTRGASSAALGSGPVASTLDESTTQRASRAELAGETIADLGRRATDYVKEILAADTKLVTQLENGRRQL
ncbi:MULTISPECIES: hypothetical protein [Cryobacterium]|uniref:hypothetical protein n=1 Tax=Cryobacterium TaxID=69578 RepID=UPI000CD467E7|nr:MULTISPECIES: hypothetical protein [Cryobacterium]POH64600.1 hypothetical protein C3B60_14330 [Cryobacterium zongtaii]TFC46311.1 hypothetical protein E3O57_07230 [Cryobacterium sp. TMN-39-2]